MPERSFQIGGGLPRRTLILGGLSSALLVACGKSDKASQAGPAPVPGSSAAPTATGPWSYRDDLGETITRDQRPARFLAYSSSAAILWDYGIKAASVIGPLKDGDRVVPSAGRVDPAVVTDLGQDSVNVEALAAARPEVIVLQRNADGLDPYPLTNEQLDDARRVAPFVAVHAYGVSGEQVIANYERLAVALGADLAAPDIQNERARFEQAKTDLRNALGAKSGLKVMFTTATPDALYVAKIADYPDLQTYKSLGMDVVEAGGDAPYFEKLSWEETTRYPADVILHDTRSGVPTSEELATKQATWRSLPAVKEGQVYDWNAEIVFSHRGFADALEQLAKDISSAKTDLV